MAVETTFEGIKVEAQIKFEQSVEDLARAQDIQNRTIALQIFTQDQLLKVESEMFNLCMMQPLILSKYHSRPLHKQTSTHTDFERIRNALFTEQEQIRSDVDRVANELQKLDLTIRLHIARNTACLDSGILSKRK